ncbi:MAG: protein kinase [Myxococcaceae bacterium]|nr:protein kinase [Myxococcaceae bacterium]
MQPRRPTDEVQSAPFSFLPSDVTGSELDARFKIRAPLRCDGIGRLDCAEDTESGMRMAVRWLPLEANGDAAVKACEKLPQHPTLPRIRQVGQVGSAAYVAMDFPDGQLLSTRLGENFGAPELMRMGGQIADALATIHTQGVFHGELSAESVLLAGDRAFLWDMPLVIANRLTDRRGEERLMQQLVKTAHYLSPERARGAPASAEGDVYALGAVLSVAAGAVLSTGSTLSVVHSVATYNWSPEVPSRLPVPLQNLLESMLSPEPKARPNAAKVSEWLLRLSAPATVPEMPQVGGKRVPADFGFSQPPTVENPARVDLPVVEMGPSVALHDNLEVAPDLAAEAVTLTAEEVNAVGGRTLRSLWGVGLAVLGVALSVLVLALRPTTKAPVAQREPQPVVAPAPVTENPAPMVAVETDEVVLPDTEALEDFLAPLKKARLKTQKPAPVKRNVTKLSEALGNHVEATPPANKDFDFLEETPPPASELKRPNF